MQEIEIKCAVPVDRLPALRKAVKGPGSRGERLQAAYFDTVDGQLESHGLSVRLRREGRRWLQTAKAGTDDPLRRLEDNVTLAPGRGRVPELDLSRHDGSPLAVELRSALRSHGKRTSGAELLLRYQTDVFRQSRTVEFQGATIEIALDTGTIAAGDRTSPICEVEFELKSGPVSALIVLASQWSAAHGLCVNTHSKAHRGARLARGQTHGPAIKAQAPTGDCGDDARRFTAAVLQASLTQVLGNTSELLAGNPSEEVIHQLRVGLRRLRTALRELQGLVSGIDDEWEQVLAAAFRELGAHRDVAVVLPGLLAQMQPEDAPALPAPAPGPAARRPETVVRAPLLQRALLQIIGFSQTGSQGEEAGVPETTSASEFVARRLRKLHRRIGRSAAGFTHLQVAEQHGVRKRLKRFRYLAEFSAALYGAKTVKRYLRHWTSAQDELGTFNDDRIAEETYRQAAAQDAKAWFVVGWLAAGHKASASRCQQALVKAGKPKPFWKV